jgi:hypothetical protein
MMMKRDTYRVSNELYYLVAFVCEKRYYIFASIRVFGSWAMAKDLFNYDIKETPCVVCGQIFPEYNIGTVKLYCSLACRGVEYNRRRREKPRLLEERNLEETRKYISSITGASVNRIEDGDSTELDVFGFPVLHQKRGGEFGEYEAPSVKVSQSGRRLWPDKAPWVFLIKSIYMDTNDCIDWPFNRAGDGYARIGNKLVTRMVCTKIYGLPPSEEYQAAHSCDRGRYGCINWKHLSWKTQLDNAGDRRGKRYNKM